MDAPAMRLAQGALDIEKLVACSYELASEAEKSLAGIQFIGPCAGQKAQDESKKKLFHIE